MNGWVVSFGLLSIGFFVMVAGAITALEPAPVSAWIAIGLAVAAGVSWKK